MTIRWQRANWPSKLPRNLITTKFSNSVNRFVTILHAFRNRNESSFWCKQSHRLPKTSKFELHLIIQNLKTSHEIRKTLEKSNDRFDKHTKIHDFKLLDKVLIKSNKTPVSLELEKIKWPFYLSEIGRPLFLLPSGVHPSVTTVICWIFSFNETDSVPSPSPHLWVDFVFPVPLLSTELLCSGYVNAILSLFLRHLTLKVSILFYSVLESFKWYLWIKLVNEKSVEILELRILIKVPYLCLLHLKTVVLVMALYSILQSHVHSRLIDE